MKIIDAHSHIDYITHKHQKGVIGTICCATDESQWQKLSNIMKHDNCIYGAFGVHPWFAGEVKDGFENRLQDLLKTDESYMVGEIGLDKYKPNMEKQIEVFIKQFDIAVRLKRPVFLHSVGTWDKILNILKRYKRSEMPIIVVHDLHGSEEIIKTLLDNYNVVFSFNKTDKMEQIRLIPNNLLLVETDAKPEASLIDIINKISDIKENNGICEIIYNNIQKVLKHG